MTLRAHFQNDRDPEKNNLVKEIYLTFEGGGLGQVSGVKGGGNLLADFVSFACRARNAEEGWVRPLPQLTS